MVKRMDTNSHENQNGEIYGVFQKEFQTNSEKKLKLEEDYGKRI